MEEKTQIKDPLRSVIQDVHEKHPDLRIVSFHAGSELDLEKQDPLKCFLPAPELNGWLGLVPVTIVDEWRIKMNAREITAEEAEKSIALQDVAAFTEDLYSQLLALIEDLGDLVIESRPEAVAEAVGEVSERLLRDEGRSAVVTEFKKLLRRLLHRYLEWRFIVGMLDEAKEWKERLNPEEDYVGTAPQ